jgi:signal transduction histidine kinase
MRCRPAIIWDVARVAAPLSPRPFAGEDRRRAPSVVGLGRVFLAGGATIVVAAGLVALAAAGGRRLAPARAADLALALHTTTVLAGAAVYAFCLARWRLVGETAALWPGTAAAAYAVAAVGLPEVVGPLATGDPAPVLPAVADAGLVVTVLVLAAGVLAPPVDTRVRAGPLLAVALAAVVVLAAAFAAWPSAGRALTLQPLRGAGTADLAAAAAVVAVWLAAATGYALRGIRRHWLYGWCGLLAFALVLAHLMAAVSDRPGDAWSVGGDVLHAVGLLVAVAGCLAEFGRVYADQRSRLFDSELTLEAAAVEARARAASQRVRRHDVGNAILAIEGAAVVLERHVERMSDQDRATISEVLSEGLSRVRRLVRDEGRGDVQVALAETAAGVVGELGWDDRVRLDVPPDLVGTGSATHTGEAVRLLLSNADRRAPSRPVTLRGERDGRWAVLRVEDLGPAVTRTERRGLAQGIDGRAPGAWDHQGIDVLVAGRLMRDQGGDLWIEPRPGAGATFALCLPLPPEPPA